MGLSWFDIFPLEIWLNILDFTVDHVSYLSLMCVIRELSDLANSSGVVKKAKTRFTKPENISVESSEGIVNKLYHKLPNGVKHGLYIETLNNVEIETMNYEDGKRNGMKVLKYNSGEVSDECFYCEGNKHGQAISYYLNGNIKIIGDYSAGVRIGVWKFYDKDGKLSREEEHLTSSKGYVVIIWKNNVLDKTVMYTGNFFKFG